MIAFRFITYQRNQILLVDTASCSASQVEKTFRALPDLVITLPRRSVLILTDFTGASFNDDAVRAMEQAAVFDKPFIKKSAWVGALSLPDEFSNRVKEFFKARVWCLQDSQRSNGLSRKGLIDCGAQGRHIAQTRCRGQKNALTSASPKVGSP